MELDESMVEEDKINRFLNMIANKYDGGLAQEYEKYYISKCKKIKKLESTLDQIESVIYNTQLTEIEARITIQEIIDKFRED